MPELAEILQGFILLNVALTETILIKNKKWTNVKSCLPAGGRDPATSNVGHAETAPGGVGPSPDTIAVHDFGVVVQIERAARSTAARGRGGDVHSLF